MAIAELRDVGVVPDGLYTLEPEGAVVTSLSEPGASRGSVPIPATDVGETFEPGPFDCNDSATIVTVQASGKPDVETVTTAMARGSTEPDGTEAMGQ